MRARLIILTLGIVTAATGAANAAAADNGWEPPDESYALTVFDLGALAGEQDDIPEPSRHLMLAWPDGCANTAATGAQSTDPRCTAT
jgi:hypothetical protein